MLKIPATDGFELVATLHEPEKPNHKMILVAAAMGVKRSFYQHFANFLAEHGFHVITFDYRGVGDSSPARLRGFPASLYIWGTQDLEGVVRWIGEHYPNHPLMTVTHSVGGQILGVLPSYQKITAAVTVASQSGYWRLWSGRMRYQIAFLWYVGIPVSTRLTGQFPAKWFGLGDMLPAEVGREWARWGRSPNYLRDHVPTHFDDMPIPIRAYSFADDSFAPKHPVDTLMSFYTRAKVDRCHVNPSEIGAKAIGHFGFFRRQFRETLWQDTVNWLKEVSHV